jgi:hypothetical protein
MFMSIPVRDAIKHLPIRKLEDIAKSKPFEAAEIGYVDSGKQHMSLFYVTGLCQVVQPENEFLIYTADRATEPSKWTFLPTNQITSYDAVKKL